MKKNQKIAILGTGSWGSALALLLASHQEKILLWGYNKHRIEEIKEHRLNPSYLPGLFFPPSLDPTTQLEEALAAQILFCAIPSKYLRSTFQSILPLTESYQGVIISCSKGIEDPTEKLMTEVLREIFPLATIGVLSGPNLALEVASGLPAAGVLGFQEEGVAESLVSLFHGTSYRCYSSRDVRGIELGGALKNIYALASGVVDGLRMGENAKAALVTRGLAEMTRMGIALGGEEKTFYGLSGIGDLMTTCFSPLSRNYQVGHHLALGEGLKEIEQRMLMVAEGVKTTFVSEKIAAHLGIEVPIIHSVATLLRGEKKASLILSELLQRPLKGE